MNAVRPVPVAKPDEFSIATQNLGRLFDDEAGGRGEVAATADYRRKLEQLASQVLQALNSPHVLAVQEAENIRVLQGLAALVKQRNGPAYRAVLIEGNDYGGIDVGFLLRDDIELLDVQALMAKKRLDRAPLFDRPPLLLQIKVQGRALDIVNVHLKSLRGTEDAEVAKKTNRKRLRQADALGQWLATRTTATPLVLLGDFNATPEAPDGVDVLAQVRAAGLVDVDERLPAAERYSYVHDCRGQALDHVWVSPALLPAVRGVAASRGNAGARLPREGATAAQRSSDHDGLVLYLRLR
ncbi:MAG TPA: endonuclease/exonuclease/phosphatase family protein [Moraxellaceae bacterium]